MLIALTGGIASGKSTVAKRFAHLGADVIDADVLAREVVAPGTPGLAALVQAFGADILTRDGMLDRARLAEHIFVDEDARHMVEGIIHPAVRELSTKRFAAHKAKHPDVRLIYQVPLLLGATGESRVAEFDRVVVVSASVKTRLDRLVHLRGMDVSQALSRIAAQVSEEERIAIADHLINTDTSLADTLAQVDELWQIWAEESPS